MLVAPWLSLPVLLTTAFPLWRAWRANFQTTLRHALAWGVSAWATWLLAQLALVFGRGDLAQLARYCGLCLTGCAGVAVLGARRPGVGAWNFVVLGLLVTLLLPVARGLGEVRLDTAFLIFLAAALAVGVLNYLPTRLGLSAVLIAAGCGIEFLLLIDTEQSATAKPWLSLAAALSLAAGPWAGLWLLGGPYVGDDFETAWLDFRDRFGVVWGQRLREQFNRAAENAGWPVTLTWFGLVVRVGATPPNGAMMLAALRALMKRFTAEGED